MSRDLSRQICNRKWSAPLMGRVSGEQSGRYLYCIATGGCHDCLACHACQLN